MHKYCLNVWANTFNRNMLKLQSCQNYACRVINGAKKYDHISPLLRELNWLPVEKLIYRISVTLAFKWMTGSAPDYLMSEFTKWFNISGWETRNSQSLHTPLFKLASGQRSFYYRTVKIWNSLDNELKLSKDVLSFKWKLKSKLLCSA